MAVTVLPPGLSSGTYRLAAGDKLLGNPDGTSVLDGWATIPAGATGCEAGGFKLKLRQFTTGVQSGGLQVAAGGAYVHDLTIDATGRTSQQGIQVQNGAADVRIERIKGYGMRGPSQKDHLIYLADCVRARVSDVELRDWTGGYAVHIYTGGKPSTDHVVDRLRIMDCNGGGAVMAWNAGVKNCTFRNLTAERSSFPTHHLFTSWYTDGGILFDRVVGSDFYFGPTGVTLTHVGIADLPVFAAPDPCQAVKDELATVMAQLASCQKLAFVEKARADEAERKIAAARFALG